MVLLNIIQIPCHHVLANEISLNLKYHIGLKQFFSINLAMGIIKNYFFVRIFDISPCVLLKFWSGELPGCEIKFHIQRVPTRHTFDTPLYPKNKKYLKKCDDDIFPLMNVFCVDDGVFILALIWWAYSCWLQILI